MGFWVHVGMPLTSFVDLFLCPSLTYCLVCVYQPCGHLLGKDWPIGAYVFDVFLCFCHVPICVLGQAWYLIVLIPDLCLLPYFFYSHEYPHTRNTIYCAIISEQKGVGCPLGVPISY